VAYMTMQEQIASHLEFLQQHDFVVDELHIDGGFIRCCPTEKTSGRGELCYQTRKTQLRNGLVGLITWIRGIGGENNTHKTYGEDFPHNEQSKSQQNITQRLKTTENIEIFWELSDELGESEYLLRKGVGYYGIRFRNGEYGKTAIVPMRDIAGRLWGYQIINPDGSKRYAKDSETKSLLHMLHKPIDGFPIGIAESYITAATCFELTGMAMVTAFSADNLLSAGVALRERFHNSPIVVFADNDRHLQENKGKIAAEALKDRLGICCQILIPDFSNYPPGREFSDWNDLVREVGVRETRKILAYFQTSGGGVS
jgi:phage/plasmid primase-like uncharacterized protein